MARIAIDATPISKNGKGLSHFLKSLLHAIATYVKPHHQFTVFLNAKEELVDLPHVPHIEYVWIDLLNTLYWDLIQLSLTLRRNPVDLLFSCSDRLPLLYSGRILLYLFELPKPRHQLGWESASNYAKFSMCLTDVWFPMSLRHVVGILTSSQSTKQALQDVFAVPSNKIHVIYPGRDETLTPYIADERRSAVRNWLNAPDGYILHFSSINDARDNTAVALHAFHQARAFIPDQTKLVIGGRTDPDRQGLTPLIDELRLQDRLVWTGFVPDEIMADVYRSAELYLDTSLYEGFGYQVLEAMSCGTPVVCSNITSLPEIVGDAALKASPRDIELFSRDIIRVLSSPALSAKMKQMGLQQAARFAWSETVDQLLSIFEQWIGD